MPLNENTNKAILALKRAIEATFDDGKWRELGYLTDSIELIEGHPRLLRSLYWGDPDYGGSILQVLPRILGEDFENLEIVANFVSLKDWLRTNDAELYTEFYSTEPVSLEEIERAGVIHSILELNQQVHRIRRSISDDPALAIGSAKELLETVLKTILGRYGHTSTSDNIPSLLSEVCSLLGLERTAVDSGTPEGRVLRRTLGNLCQIVTGVGEIRNLIGTGHGRSRGSSVDVIHAKLVVNATAAIATYLLEVWEAQRRPST